MAEPQLAAQAGSVRTMERILARRGISALPGSEGVHENTDNPGDPAWHHGARVDYALARWEAATPPRFRRAEATLPDVRAWADRALSNPASAGALLLTGHTGTGKTHEAYGALKRIAAGGPERYEVLAVNSADMYGSLRPSQTAGASEWELKRLSNVPLLFLDDFGSSKSSEWTEEVTYRLMNHRYNFCLPTIITSNLPARDTSGRDLTDFVGERVASRLAEMVTTLVPMIGEDRRRTPKAA